jgi:hypothetical protein
MHLRFGGVLIRDPHLTEVVLRKPTRQPFKPHQRDDGPDAQRLRQRIHRALAAPVARQAGTMQQLHRSQQRILRQRLDEDVTIGFGFRGPADLSSCPLGDVIDVCDWRFCRDPSSRLLGDAAERGDLGPRVIRATQDLNLVSLEHVDHPFPRRKPNLRRFSDPVGLPAGGQNFRKGSGQNFRNPQ